MHEGISMKIRYNNFKHTILLFCLLFIVKILISCNCDDNRIKAYLTGFWCNRFPASDYSSGYIFNDDGNYIYFSPLPITINSLYYGNSGRWRVRNHTLEIKRDKVYLWSENPNSAYIKDNILRYFIDQTDWISICDLTTYIAKLKSESYLITKSKDDIVFSLLAQVDSYTYKSEKYILFALISRLDADSEDALQLIATAQHIEKPNKSL